MPWCAFSIDCPLKSFLLLLGSQHRCPRQLMGGCRYRVFLKKWPGPWTGVHLRELSAYGRCPLVGVRLYQDAIHSRAAPTSQMNFAIHPWDFFHLRSNWRERFPVIKQSPFLCFLCHGLQDAVLELVQSNHHRLQHLERLIGRLVEENQPDPPPTVERTTRGRRKPPKVSFNYHSQLIMHCGIYVTNGELGKLACFINVRV